jgi:hypothetical protein
MEFAISFLPLSSPHKLPYPVLNFFVACASGDEILELLHVNSCFGEEMLIHWTAELEFAVPTHQCGAAFIQRTSSMSFSGEFFGRRSRFFAAQITRELFYSIQVFHVALHAKKMHAGVTKANGSKLRVGKAKHRGQQRVAAEMNLSETAFFWPESDAFHLVGSHQLLKSHYAATPRLRTRTRPPTQERKRRVLNPRAVS